MCNLIRFSFDEIEMPRSVKCFSVFYGKTELIMYLDGSDWWWRSNEVQSMTGESVMVAPLYSRYGTGVHSPLQNCSDRQTIRRIHSSRSPLLWVTCHRLTLISTKFQSCSSPAQDDQYSADLFAFCIETRFRRDQAVAERSIAFIPLNTFNQFNIKYVQSAIESIGSWAVAIFIAILI